MNVYNWYTSTKNRKNSIHIPNCDKKNIRLYIESHAFLVSNKCLLRQTCVKMEAYNIVPDVIDVAPKEILQV